MVLVETFSRFFLLLSAFLIDLNDMPRIVYLWQVFFFWLLNVIDKSSSLFEWICGPQRNI